MKRIIDLKTISGKIVLFIVIVITLCGLFSAFIVSQVVRDQLEENYEVDKVAATESLSYSLAPVLDLYDYRQVERIITSSLTYENIASITVFNKGGILIVSATEQNTSPEELDVYTYEITNDDRIIGSIEIGFSNEYINIQRRTVTRALVSSLVGFLLIVGLALFFFINRSVINPLEVFAKAVKGVDFKNLSLRVNIHSEDEIGVLARNFNQMANNLEKSQALLMNLNIELEDKVKKRTSEFELSTKEAELANQSKSDFLANMSHELRTPLNAIIGFSQVLQEQYFGKLNEKQTEYMTDIHESGQHLLSLINDILDLSKIEAGKMELELSDVKIKELIEGSLTMIKEKALVHGISLNINCSKEMDDLRLMADERKLKQVMFNLLSNASKFTPDGGSINIKGWKEGELLNISVEDTGIGLSPEDQEKVFGEFYQVNSNMTNKTPGTGLGLPLTRSIIEMHDGRIWVESEGEGKGSRFTFSLPIKSKGVIHGKEDSNR